MTRPSNDLATVSTRSGPEKHRDCGFQAGIQAISPTSPAVVGCWQQLLTSDSPVQGFWVLLGRFPHWMERSAGVAKWSPGQGQTPEWPWLSREGDNDPKVQAKHITSCQARWATAAYLPFHITIWKVLAQQASWFFLLQSLSAHDRVMGQELRTKTQLRLKVRCKLEEGKCFEIVGLET